MTKLYYSKTSCGASSFIACFMSNLNYECEEVDLSTHLTYSGVDFYSINPKGNVPCLVLDDGTVLNENISCLLYIDNESEKSDNPGFLLPESSVDRHKTIQLLSWIASELHSSIGLLFKLKRDSSIECDRDQIKCYLKKNVRDKLNYLEEKILEKNGNRYLIESDFTLADIYLHIVLSWLGYIEFDISEFNSINMYYQYICGLEEIKEAKGRMLENPKNICN